MLTGIAGTLESNDAMITVTPADKLTIEVKSVVDAFYHDQIVKVIKDTLFDSKIANISVMCQDKGALDYTIRARLLTAISRMEEQNG
ncbi:MAG: citrate lyase acyl carrier protein [Candidatus Izemoplasmatales bacterium]|nr:citrate lyase acyl carrier protein [Candidatus Izemoplasmatales bacterium]